MADIKMPRHSDPNRMRYVHERLLRRCSTENQINRLHISLSNRITPAELRAICGPMPQATAMYSWFMEAWNRKFPKAPDTMLRDWKARMIFWSNLSGKRSPEPFLRRRVARFMDLYTDGVRDRSKSLVVCFTDSGHRLLLPIPTFVQHFQASCTDLLVIKDPRRGCFIKGLPGIAGEFEGLAQAIESVIDRDAYRAIVSFGVSGGGLAALTFAAMAGLDKGVSVSGAGRNYQTPGSKKLLDRLDESMRAGRTRNLLVIYGRGFELDREAALSLARTPSIRALAVTSRKGEIHHNPLFPLLREGKLAAFLETATDATKTGFADANGNQLPLLYTRTAWRPRILGSVAFRKKVEAQLTQRAKPLQLSRRD